MEELVCSSASARLLHLHKAFTAWFTLCKASKSRHDHEQLKLQMDEKIMLVAAQLKVKTDKNTASDSGACNARRKEVSARQSCISYEMLADVSQSASSSPSLPPSSSDRPPSRVGKRLADFQKRAAEREKRHTELRLLKDQQQTQEAEIKKQAEEAAKKEELDRKRRLAQERREKIETEKLLKQRKQNELEMLRTKISYADEFRKKVLMTSHGMNPWKTLTKMQHDKWEIAANHYNQQLCKKFVRYWYDVAQDVAKAKQGIADRMIERLWKSIILRHLSQVRLWEKRQHANISILANNFRKRRLLLVWRCYIVDTQIHCELTVKKCTALFARYTKTVFLEKWKTLPATMKEEKLRSTYIRQLVATVQHIVPDFSIPDQFVQQWALEPGT